MDHTKRASVIIQEVLNLALNRHIHVLSDAGYLDAKKYQKDYGFRGSKPQPALKMKQALIEEMCRRFEPAIADYLEYPREQLWPVHDEQTVKAQLHANFPDGKL
jgi:hypothetical protein